MLVAQGFALLLLLLVSLALSFVEADTGDKIRTEGRERLRRSVTENERKLECTAPRRLLQSGDSLFVGHEWFSWPDKYAAVKQEDNGNLVVRRTSDWKVLCETGFNGLSDDVPYYTKLQGDGNLVTWYSPDRFPPVAWKSDVTGPDTVTYYLAVDCNDNVSIYQGSIYGPVMWTCPNTRGDPPPSPTTAPPPGSQPAPNPFTTFCVVADAPYKYSESLKLLEHVENMDSDCEFVAHLGDIRSARAFDTCVQETYSNASLIMRRSKKPVLMLLGDNEWNDCPNHEEALSFWHDEFDNFPNKHWTHGFNITSQPERIENMYFVHNQALFITLNMVGGRIIDDDEWDNRLTSNFFWTRELIKKHVRGAQADANVVVIMAHATNSQKHWRFFHGMRDYIEYDLDNSVPILYLNGDTHSWVEQSNFYEQWNWKRITVDGNAREKPLKVTVDASSYVKTVEEAFSFVRFY